MVAKDEKRAAELYPRACDGGDGLGCYNLAVAYVQGIGVSKDLKRAFQLFKQACDRGDAQACPLVRK